MKGGLPRTSWDSQSSEQRQMGRPSSGTPAKSRHSQPPVQQPMGLPSSGTPAKSWDSQSSIHQRMGLPCRSTKRRLPDVGLPRGMRYSRGDTRNGLDNVARTSTTLVVIYFSNELGGWAGTLQGKRAVTPPAMRSLLKNPAEPHPRLPGSAQWKTLLFHGKISHFPY